MPLSNRDQQQVQQMIEAASPEEREQRRAEAKDILALVNASMGRLLSKELNKQGEIAIEILTRIEATEQGKGAWFRAKRRIQLTQMYLGS